MLAIEKIDHIGIRVREKTRATSFYESLGFAFVTDAGFEQGHPIMLRHPSGVVLNLLGPTTEDKDWNMLMDVDQKYAGYTHMALKVASLADLEIFLDDKKIEITGRFTFKDMSAVFIRDPDRNVIEFDEYPGDHPASRLISADDEIDAHP
ncbi:MAG: glyoxalase [Rhodobiaceae bacterium]|nr:MAG: glyoxalase [Rhodobiaceae bacterium]